MTVPPSVSAEDIAILRGVARQYAEMSVGALGKFAEMRSNALYRILAALSRSNGEAE